VPGGATVPTGTGIFSVTSVGNVPVGADGVVQLVVDNAWTPMFGDTYIDIGWDPAIIEYESSTIKVLNTTAAVSGDRMLRIMLGDFRRGYPQGRYPLADIRFRTLAHGSTTLSVSVDHVRYWSEDLDEFTDITQTASGRNGIYSTGPLPVETQPLVTFTQNTLAPSSYDNDVEATTARTTTPTATPTTTVTPTTTTIASTSTTVAPGTSVPTPSVNVTTADYGTYAPVSTRVQSSGILLLVGLISIALATVAYLASRRD
jgi:hypothetical protein